MKILILILAILSFNCNADQYTKNINVIVSLGAGSIVDTTCRKIFEIYDQLNNTNTVITNMAGADHMVAHKHFITLTEPSILCAGTSVGGLNQFKNPTISPATDTLKPVINLFSSTFLILAPVTGAGSVEELISNSKRTGKSILVGAPTTNTAAAFTYILDKTNSNYEVVVFRKPSDAVAALREGAIDVYVDGGSLNQLIDTAKAKEIAHIMAGASRNESVNLRNKYTEIDPLMTKIMLHVKSDVPDSEIAILNARVNSAMNSTQFKSYAKDRMSIHTITNGTVKQAEQTLLNLRNYLKNVRN